MEKNDNLTFKRSSPVQELKDRVKKIKPLLPKGWRSILIRNHKEYDTMSGSNLLDNILNGRSSDITLTTILERIASGELK